MLRSTRFAGVVGLGLTWALAGGVSAQEVGARFRVLVPDLEAKQGADRDFGEDVAEALRELLGALPTHRAVERRVLERALDQVDLDMKDLDCNLTRQLAVRMQVQVALCASYVQVERDRYSVVATFWDVASGESFSVEPTVGEEREPSAVALHVFEAFDRYTAHARAATNCEGLYRSNLLEAALEACDAALALNSDAVGVRYRRARTLFDLGRPEEARRELADVLERDPIHEPALELAGYVSGTLDRTDEAVDYYTRYLQLNPGNAPVRTRVAYDLATAGDLRGALLLIREGLDGDSDNVDLWEQLGGYAFALAEDVNRSEPGEDAGGLTPGAAEYYREAIDAYERVFVARGADTRVGHLRSLVIANLRLDRPGPAVAVASEGVEVHPDDPGLWSVYADALRRSGRLDEALDALARVEALDPAYRNLGLRRGSWLIEAGPIEEAARVLTSVAENEPERADDAARLLLADAHASGVEEARYDYAIRSIELIRGMPNLSEAMGQQLNFWHGYTLLRAAMVEQEPRTVETARATGPKFVRVLELFEQVGEYPSSVSVSIEQLRASVRTYLEIQEAIVRRGG